MNDIISLVAHDNTKEITEKIVAVIKRKLKNDTVYTNNFCQTLSELIAYQPNSDIKGLDEIMKITYAIGQIKTLILLIDLRKIPMQGFNLLKQLVKTERKKYIQKKKNTLQQNKE